MPDPNRETISGSQVAAMFDKSPYLTSFALWHTINGSLRAGDDDPDERMEWGTRLEPAIIQATAERMSLIAHRGVDVLADLSGATFEPLEYELGVYLREPRHGVGVTLDGTIIDPNRGPGIIEAKNVDWLQWKDGWTETEAPPHIEMQVQTEMLVTGTSWAVIACLVGGNELRLYERSADTDMQKSIAETALSFLASIRDGKEPEPSGRAMDYPWIAARWPEVVPDPVLDLRAVRDFQQTVREYGYWTEQEAFARKSRNETKAALLGITKDHATARAHGYVVEVKKTPTDAQEIGLPVEIADPLYRTMQEHPHTEPSDEFWGAVADALAWTHTTRAAGVQTRIKVREIPDEIDETPPWGDDFANKDMEIIP